MPVTTDGEVAEARIRAALDAGRRRRLHTAVPLTGGGADCVCGKPITHKIHRVAAPAEPPEVVVSFQPGDRVRCIDQDDSHYGRVGTVTSTELSFGGTRRVITVVLDPAGIPSSPAYGSPAWFTPGALQKLVKPPKFASVEEADAWLEANE